jgi:hypothetical protein
MFSAIRTAIINKLNSDAVTKIQVAYRTDRSTLEGFPAAVVSPSDNAADWSSTDKDRRTYAFKIRVYYPIKKEAEQDTGEIALEEALDELLSVFSSHDALGDACDWIEPVPSVWAYEERSEGVYRMAELSLRCIVYSAH